MALMKKLQQICAINFIIILLCACSPHEENENKTASSEITVPVQYIPLENGEHNNFGNTQPETIIITDEKAWHDFWGKLHGNINPIPPLPQISFNDEMVIAILDAPRSTPTLSFSLESLSKTKNDLLINVLREEPGKSCMMAQMMSQPYIIIKTLATPEKAVLNIMPKVAECE